LSRRATGFHRQAKPFELKRKTLSSKVGKIVLTASQFTRYFVLNESTIDYLKLPSADIMRRKLIMVTLGNKGCPIKNCVQDVLKRNSNTAFLFQSTLTHIN